MAMVWILILPTLISNQFSLMVKIFGSHGSHVATTMAAKNDGNEINGLAVQAFDR